MLKNLVKRNRVLQDNGNIKLYTIIVMIGKEQNGFRKFYKNHYISFRNNFRNSKILQ